MAESKHTNLKPATRLVEAGRSPQWTGGAVVNPPIWRASTHLYPDVATQRGAVKYNEDGQFFYGRRGAPTQWALAEALTSLESGADGTVLYPSGVAAIAGALLAVLRPGDVLLLADNVYEPSRAMATGMLADFGIGHRFFDPLDLDAYQAAFCDKTRAVLLETPGSLTMEVPDIPAQARIARERGALSLIDNTWASSLGFPALEHGCDIAIMSLTKHVGGHSDLMMGSASAREELYGKLRLRAQNLGIVVSPDDCALALRGLRTLDVRLERQSASALRIAQWLADCPQVAQVLCPMLDGAPGNALWKRDFKGGCGLFSFVFRGGTSEQCDRFVDALELFGIGYSWGGYESLALPIRPRNARTATSWPLPDFEPADQHGVRLAIGLEHADDLIEDLKQAMTKAGWA